MLIKIALWYPYYLKYRHLIHGASVEKYEILKLSEIFKEY